MDKAAKTQRVLACQLCQQRKVKCDRKFPCANCVRAGAQCAPATVVPRQRRRRFPERELLARIRHYEALLRQHNVQFEPLHPPAPGSVAAESTPSPGDAHVATPDTPRTTYSEPSNQEKAPKQRTTNLWHALSRKPETEDDNDDASDDDERDSRFLGDDDDMGNVIKTAWDRTYHNTSESSHHLLFGSPASTVALTTLHPDQAKIFRLWQVYLDNVNPLLKVTHTPSLQARIIDAMSDLASISAPLEALLFSIYCIAVLSLAEDQCRTLFGSPRKDLLAGYQFGCRQALLNANVLQSSDHDRLTALFLYLISVKPSTDPRSLSSMLAVAIHMAQRMGYHKESSNEKRPVLEAEMRRRLWWALVMFDARVCEVYNYRTATLGPTWNCRTPLNLNDFELLTNLKTAPAVNDKPTEALFVLVRSEISDFIRHCAFHLDFIDPFLTTFAGTTKAADGKELQEMKHLLTKTLAHCDPANPLHFMTMWTARGLLARNLLLEHCSRQPDDNTQEQHDQNQEPAITHALAMLDCDTHLMSSPLTRGFRWHLHSHFPFLAYTYIAQHLKRRKRTHPTATRIDDDGDDDDKQAATEAAAWQAMSDNYEARDMDFSGPHQPIFVLFSRVILQAWEAVGGDGEDRGEGMPRIVASIKGRMAEMQVKALKGGYPAEQSGQEGPQSMSGLSMVNVGGESVGGQDFVAVGTDYPDVLLAQGGMEFMEMDQLWPADWGLMHGRSW